MTKRLVLIVLMFMMFHKTFARTFYVSNSGNDSYSILQAQSVSTPWATLSRIQSTLSTFGPGDSILFMKGNVFSGTLRIFGKNRMYFGSYGIGNNPVFCGTDAVITTLFRLTTCSNITFEGLTISDTSISFTDRTVQAKIQRVFIIESNSTGNQIISCKMERIGYGVYITAKSNGQTIRSCDISNLRMIKNTPKTINPDDDYGGVPVQISSRNNIITRNYFHDCYAVSYDYGYDGGGIEFFEEGDTISGNVIMYNTFYDNNGTLEHGSNADGVANNPIQNNTFAYNKVINCEGLLYINNRGQYKTRVKNLMVYNNVIVETSVPRLGIGRDVSMATSDTTMNIVNLRNNIFRLTNGFSVAKSTVFTGLQLTHTNNVYQVSGGGSINFTLGKTEISTLTTIWANITNPNPINWNYNPVSPGPAINRGIYLRINTDFDGKTVSQTTPEAGILEF
jgi:hypothetical protein